MRSPQAASTLVDRRRWPSYTPRTREVVLSTVLAEDRLTITLVEAMARGDVPATSLGPSQWRRLTKHRTPSIRARAEALYSATEVSSSRSAFEQVQRSVLARAGNGGRGAEVFAVQCAACHTFNGAGGRVGPDLSGISNQPPEALLLHIVAPDYEITPGYESYSVQTRDGRTIVGRLESEAPNSLTLRDASGDVQTILRADVQEMAAASASLMPGGLGQALSSQQLADVIAYLKRR
jgi:putative heme-binding domain-containing protein